MAVYVLYIVVIAIQWWVLKNLRGCFCGNGNKEAGNNNLFILIACLELIILAGIRGYNVGADTNTYLSALNYYKSIPRNNILISELVYPYAFEPGYFWLTKICAFLQFDETAFLFLIAIIIYTPVFAAIYRDSDDPYISILSYFAFGLFAYSLGIFRQMIAVSIVISGRNFIRNREFIKYLLIILSAMMFHLTALIALGLYFLYPLNWKINVMLTVAGTIFSLVAGRPIVLLLTKISSQYATIQGSIYDSNGGSYTMLLVWVILLILNCCLNSIKVPQGNGKIAFDALCAALIVQGLGYSMALFGRIIGYFTIYLIFLIPDLIHLFAAKSRRTGRALIILALIALIAINFNANMNLCRYVPFWK